jgi:hypothetical protein
MTRTAAWVGLALGASACATFVVDLGKGVGAVPVGGIAVSLLVLVGAARSLGGHRGGQMAMYLAALPLLARFLVVYFRTYRVWPALVLIALATVTFGLGLLGYFMDRFQAPKEEGEPPL